MEKKDLQFFFIFHLGKIEIVTRLRTYANNAITECMDLVALNRQALDQVQHLQADVKNLQERDQLRMR